MVDALNQWLILPVDVHTTELLRGGLGLLWI